MHKKQNNSLELSKHHTPSTTISASPKSDRCFSFNKSYKSKGLLLDEYEGKLFMLHKMVSAKTQEMKSRFETVSINSKILKARQENNAEKINSEIHKLNDRGARLFFINSSIKEAEIQELESKIIMQEINLNALSEEKHNLKSKLDYELLQITQNTDLVSSINQKLLKNYEIQNDLKTSLMKMTQTKIEYQQQLKLNVLEFEKFQAENKKFHSKQIFVNVEKNKIKGVKSKNEIKAMLIENHQLCIEEEKKNFESNTKIHENLKTKFRDIIERIKAKINNLETYAEKVELEHCLVQAKKKVLSENSTQVFSKSKEIFELLKQTNENIVKMSMDSEKLIIKNNDLQNKILEVQEQHAKIEKNAYLRERLQENLMRQ